MTSDADLDRLLSGWLTGVGPSRAPDWVATGALDQIAALPQRGPRRWLGVPRALRGDGRRPTFALVATCAALVGLGVAIGVGIGANLMEQKPSPIPPDAEPAADGLRRYTSPGRFYTIELPEGWWPGSPVAVSGPSPIGTRRYGAGSLIVSIGSETGDVVICNPTCSSVTGQKSTDQLIHILERDAGTVSVGSDVVAGIDATVVRTRSASSPNLTHIAFVWAGRPVVITIDYSKVAAPAETYTRIIDSIRLAELRDGEPVGPTFEAPDGSYRLDLPEPWRQAAGPDANAAYGSRGANTHLSIHAGDATGRVVPCDVQVTSTGADTASGWEVCDEVTITSLDDVRQALALHPISYGPSTAYSDVVVDGEPGILQLSSGYEYPARSGQYLAYIVAIHNGRPYVIRIWTPVNQNVLHVDDVLEAFRFND